jgi:hypothetical protein
MNSIANYSSKEFVMQFFNPLIWRLRAALGALVFALAACGGGAGGGTSVTAPAGQNAQVAQAGPSASGPFVSAAPATTPGATAQGAVMPFVDSPVPETGWWLNLAEPGRGFAIEQQGNQIFIAGFLYETTGRATWFVSTLTLQADGSFTGGYDRYSGGQTLAGAFKPATKAPPSIAVRLTLTSPTNGSLRFEGPTPQTQRTIALERWAFVAGRPASASTFQNGWWLNEAEAGRGYFIEVQGSQAFIGAFMYDDAGEPVWYVSSTPVVGGALPAALDQYADGQALFSPFKNATKLAVSPGSVRFGFAGADTGALSLPGNRLVTTKRFIFNNAAPPSPAVSSSFDYTAPSLAAFSASQGQPCFSPAAGNKISLRIPAGSSPANKLPLLIVLSGGSNGAPISQYTGELNNLAQVGGYAVATFGYSTCGFTSPLVFADPNNGASEGEFSRAFDAIKAHITANNLNVDLGKVALLGNSWSSNYIRTLAVKYGSTYNIVGALATAGGCNFGCAMNGFASGEPNAYPLVGGKKPVIAAISTPSDVLYRSLASLGGAAAVCSSPTFAYGLGADAAKFCFKKTIPVASQPIMLAFMDAAGGGHGVFSPAEDVQKKQFIRYMFGFDAIPAALSD